MSEKFVENFKMITTMSSVTCLFALVSVLMFIWANGRKLSKKDKIIIGIIFGFGSILSTHFGINYEKMLLNVRDLGPLIAGLYFDPLSGIIAGFVGGIERYIVGTYFNVGSYTRIACSVSTCLAGILAWFLNRFIFKGKRPLIRYALFAGATMEVFHMYAVLITHRSDITSAYYVVDVCSNPMIFFTAIGMALTVLLIELYENRIKFPLKIHKNEELDLSSQFQTRLLVLMFLLATLTNSFMTQIGTETAYQNASASLRQNVEVIRRQYDAGYSLLGNVYVEHNGQYTIQNSNGKILYGAHSGENVSKEEMDFLRNHITSDYFVRDYFGQRVIAKCVMLKDWNILLVAMPLDEVLLYNNIQGYELRFSSILLFSAIFLFIALMLNSMVVKNMDSINSSLLKITNGNLDEKVDVNKSSEFVELSNGINETVTALKGYIEEEKNRIEQELEFARNIQQSSLPKNFKFPNHDEFELYANMRAAKEVGGDFYDFFFIDESKIVLVIADVSGKNISGALFMMRAKTAIQSFVTTDMDLQDILAKVNNSLCEGNTSEMFVTAWVAIVDLKTGVAKCANYGHEFPIIMRSGGNYEIYKDAHSLPLAAFEGTKAKVYDIKFNPGDRIFVYTDGIPEAINKEDVQYGMDRLLNELNKNKDMQLEDLLKTIRASLKNFANGAEQFDDITMLAFNFNKYFEE